MNSPETTNSTQAKFHNLLQANVDASACHMHVKRRCYISFQFTHMNVILLLRPYTVSLSIVLLYDGSHANREREALKGYSVTELL